MGIDVEGVLYEKSLRPAGLTKKILDGLAGMGIKSLILTFGRFKEEAGPDFL